MAEIVLKDIKKSFGNVEVLHNINLSLPDKKLTVFVGPSGCGKSTLLRLITGLEEPTSGNVLIDGKCMNGVPPAKRGLAMVFQSYALYPHMTVFENIAFGLRLSENSKDEIQRKVSEVAKVLHIEQYLNRRPKQLSGGQRQRVAIGRALVRKPDIYLFDEPLSNIDATLRVQMRTELAKFKVDLQKTMVYVTHDQVEAMTLADQIVVLNHGWVEQVGDPLTLYHHPINKFVASFIGSPQINFLPIKEIKQSEETISLIIDGKIKIEFPAKECPVLDLSTAKEIGIRPEHLDLTSGKMHHIKGKIHVVEHLGSESYVDLSLTDKFSIMVRMPGTKNYKYGDQLGIRFHPQHLHFFDDKGEALPRKKNISSLSNTQKEQAS